MRANLEDGVELAFELVACRSSSRTICSNTAAAPWLPKPCDNCPRRWRSTAEVTARVFDDEVPSLAVGAAAFWAMWDGSAGPEVAGSGPRPAEDLHSPYRMFAGENTGTMSAFRTASATGT